MIKFIFIFYLSLLYISVFLKIMCYFLNLKFFENIFKYLKYKFYFKLFPEIKIKNSDKNYIDNKKLKSTIIISNHFTVHDGMILSYLFDDIYFIAKDDIFTSNFKNIFLNYFNKYLYASFNWIPYKRGNKTSGQICRKEIIKLLRSGKNICIFPEGKSQLNGVPLKFYNGIFEIAVENNFDILPFAIYYKPFIGIVPGKKINLYNDYKLKPKLKYFIFNIFKSNTKYKSEELNNKIYNLIKNKILDFNK